MSIAVVGIREARRAYEIINDHLNTIKKNENVEEVMQSLVSLGVHPQDVEAMLTMRAKVIEAMSLESVILPSSSDPGVFFIYNLGGVTPEERERLVAQIKEGLSSRKPSLVYEPTAVFKLGSKRASLELTARKIAHLVGLSNHIIPGAFFSIKNPDLSSWAESAQEDLYNGGFKEFCYENEGDFHVTGILEPFLKSAGMSKERKKEQFVFRTFIALVLGLRDAREDNLGEKIFDLEEIMPGRLDPLKRDRKTSPQEFRIIDKKNGEVAATHLPFLNNPLLDEPINGKDLDHMKRIVDKWNIDEIVEEVCRELIVFADEISERCENNEEVTDENGCKVRVELPDVEEVFNEDELYSPKKIEEEISVFDKNQIESFKKRITRLKTFFKGHEKKITPRDLVEAVDPFYIEQVRLVEAFQFEDRKRAFSSGEGSPFSVNFPFRYVGVLPKPSNNGTERKRAQSCSEGALGRRSPFEVAGRFPVGSAVEIKNPKARKAFVAQVFQCRKDSASEE